MLNQIVLVGRICGDFKKHKQENGNNIASMTLAVPRNYKNANGEYDTDFLNVQLFGGIAENTIEYCKNGDLVGVKGRVQGENNKMQIIAEKLTFLSSKKKEED